MSGPCLIPANPGISGIGVQVAICLQNLLYFVPAVWAIWDGNVSDYELDLTETHATTNLVLAFAILISCIVQALTQGLTNYHASIVLSLSWINNTNAFIYLLLCVRYRSQDGGIRPHLSEWLAHIKTQAKTVVGEYHPACSRWNPKALTCSPGCFSGGALVFRNRDGEWNPDRSTYCI